MTPVFYVMNERDRHFANAFQLGTMCEIRPWMAEHIPGEIPVIRGIWDEFLTKFKQYKTRKIDFVEIDNGYLLKSPGAWDGYFRFNINSLQHNYVMENQPLNRLNKLIEKGLNIQPWQHNKDGHILICTSGAQAEKYYDLDTIAWTNNVLESLRLLNVRREIVVREKPKAASLFKTMHDDFKGAYCVITHTSMIAVDAILAGIPAIVDSLSCAAPVARININDINDLYYGSRTKWLKSLSMCQFTIEEMASGYAWSQTLKNIEYLKNNDK